VTDESSDPNDETTTDDAPATEEPSLTGDLDPEQLDAVAEAQRAMEDARARLAEVPAEVVVTNHVMGLYELAAIHLSAAPPDLGQAALAIDAVACLVDGLGDRLGEDAGTMRDALNNIRLAFVQIQGSAAGDDAPHAPGADQDV
jgi:ribosomal protein S5